MTAATRIFSRPVLYISGAAVAAVFAAGAFFLNAPLPATQALPEMAEHPVVLPDGEPLYVQRHEVTVAAWNLCHADGGCGLKLRVRKGFDPDTTPATGLSFVDVSEYLQWYNQATRHRFRLPTTAEWEYMARSVLPEVQDPIFTDPSLTWASSYLNENLAPRSLEPQGSFSTSPEGIADLDGSVWEWTQDCYAGAVEDVDLDRCPAFFVGGEHLAAVPFLVRDPARGGCAVGAPPAHLGVRLVSDTAVAE